MTKRWIVSGAVVVALLAVTAGIAYAAGSGGGPSTGPAAGQMLVGCDAMHDSPGMLAMHDHMPAALQARCDAMHEQMDSMMSGSSMMGGSGKTGASMAGHHPSTEG